MEFEIFGAKVEADLFNPDEMKKLEDSIDVAIKKVNDATKCDTGSEGIRMQCEAVIECLDNVFGENAAQKIFGGKTNLLDCLSAFEDVCFVHEQMTSIIDSKVVNIKARVAKAKAKK